MKRFFAGLITAAIATIALGTVTPAAQATPPPPKPNWIWTAPGSGDDPGTGN